MLLFKQISIYSIIFLFFVSCSSNEQGEELEGGQTETSDLAVISVSENQFTGSGFELGKIENKTFNKVLQVNGSTHLPEKNKAIVSTLVGGSVGPIDLIHGQWIKKGQLLFSIANPELIDWQQNYLVLQGELEYQEGELERQQILAVENIAAKKNLNQAVSNVKITKAKLAGLAEKLTLIGIKPSDISESNFTSRLNVYAPSSGYLTEIDVKQGMYLEKFQGAMEISNTNHIHMELKVLEKDLSKLKNKQKVKYSLQEDSGKLYDAEIYLIEKHVDENRMVNVHCHLDKAQEKSLLPGMFVSAKISLDTFQASAVSEDAIVAVDKKKYILEHRKGSEYEFIQREVKVLSCQDGFCQIVNEDLQDKDIDILTKGAYYILLGASG